MMTPEHRGWPKRNPRPFFHCECGDHAFVALTAGYSALCSPEDVPELSKFTWWPTTNRRAYAWTEWRVNNKRKCLYMQRAVLPAGDDLFVDHINGDGLDNRRSNLRLCTNQQNQGNRRKVWGVSKFRGVTRQGQKWNAALAHKYLGAFHTEEEAARAYDKAARKRFGAFFFPNLPEETDV